MLRDWGHAKDYIEGMWLMLQQDKPDDFVLATGVTHTVRHFVDLAFNRVGVELKWEGAGIEEKGFDVSTGKVVVEVDAKYFRPTEVELLIGDPSKAQKELGWKHKYELTDLVNEMIDADVKTFKRELFIKEQGL